MRHFYLLFVLLCMGTRLSAQTLKASYTVDKAAVCSSQSAVQFTDQSTGSVTSWKWNFGDGTTSSAQNPSHTFAKNGRYVVYLVVSDATGKTDTAWVSDQRDAVYVLPVLATPSLYLMTSDQTLATLRDTGYASQFPEYAYSYKWSSGETTSSINVSGDGTYKVSLTQCGQTVSNDVPVMRLTVPLSITPFDSGSHNLNAPDSVKVGYNIANPFPYQAYSSYLINLGYGYYDYGFLYPNAVYNFDYPTDLIRSGLKVTLNAGVEYHGPTEVTYDLVPRAPAIHFNSWNGKDTTFYEGDTLWLYDTNPNADDYWYGSGIAVIDGDHIGITGSGTAHHTINGVLDYGFEEITYTMKQRLKAAFDVIPSACNAGIVDLKFSGTVAAEDTIVTYNWRINGETRFTGKNPTGKELPYEGDNTIELTVITAGGARATITKVINVPPSWYIVSSVKEYGCGDSALITATVNTTDHYTLTWSTGQTGNNIMVKSSGQYIANLVDDCGDLRWTDSVWVDLERVSLVPVITPIAGYLVTGQYGGYTNNWYRNDTLIATSSSIQPTIEGIYTVDKVGPTCTKVSEPYYFFSGLTIKVDVESNKCSPQSGTLYGSVVYVPAGDSVISEVYDYGDGTIHTRGGLFHYYEQPGDYTVSYTVTTRSGAKAVVSKDVKIVLPPSIKLEIHRGAQDTIMAYPVNYDQAHYQQMQWMNEARVIAGANAWYFIPSADGYYTIVSEVYNCSFVPSVYYSATTAKAIVVVPAANADSLRMEANFRGTVFNADNEFTVQLSTDNGNARTLGTDEVIDLGVIKGTDPTRLTVAIPDSLACASNYVIRVVSSSPADITTWSGTFSITNTPAQPGLTQVGDSLFTNSTFALQWYKDDVAIPGTTAAAIRAKANGVYKVAALNGSCSTLSEARTVVVTAVADVTIGGNTVTAFPNPSEGKVYLKFATPLTEKVLVKVISVNGATMYTTTTMQQQTLLELSSLPKGYYLVEVNGKGTRKVLTIILQ